MYFSVSCVISVVPQQTHHRSLCFLLRKLEVADKF